MRAITRIIHLARVTDNGEDEAQVSIMARILDHTHVSTGFSNTIASYVGGLADADLGQLVDFVFTRARPARMRRGEIMPVWRPLLEKRHNQPMRISPNPAPPLEVRDPERSLASGVAGAGDSAAAPAR